MSKETTSKQLEEKELNDLLDSALEDFNKQEPEVEESLEETWTKDFTKETVDELQENMQKLLLKGNLLNESELEDCFKTMAETMVESFSNVMMDQEAGSAENVEVNFQSAIEKALNDLSTTSENLSNDANLSEMLAQTSLEDKVGVSLGFMQGMLQRLLSKEVLYPSLKELVSDKYPKWLEENKDTLPASDIEKYNQQLSLIKKICDELETEKDDNSEEVKKKRFETIVSLIQEVESCGQLPEDLVGEQSNPFQFDSEGAPTIPSMLRGMDLQQNCRLM